MGKETDEDEGELPVRVPDISPQGLANSIQAVKAGSDANTEAISIINARAEVSLRNRALSYSMVMTLLFITIHVWFAAVNRPLQLPDMVNEIIWSIILAPWLGVGMGRLTNLITDKFGGDKK